VAVPKYWEHIEEEARRKLAKRVANEEMTKDDLIALGNSKRADVAIAMLAKGDGYITTRP